MLHVQIFGSYTCICVGLCHAFIFDAWMVVRRLLLMLLLVPLPFTRKWLWRSWCACGIRKIVREIPNNVPSTPSGKPIQLCLHIDKYHTKSFVFKFNLTSFATHRRITNSAANSHATSPYLCFSRSFLLFGMFVICVSCAQTYSNRWSMVSALLWFTDDTCTQNSLHLLMLHCHKPKTCVRAFAQHFSLGLFAWQRLGSKWYKGWP